MHEIQHLRCTKEIYNLKSASRIVYNMAHCWGFFIVFILYVLLPLANVDNSLNLYQQRSLSWSACILLLNEPTFLLIFTGYYLFT
jgi:hypothetical protein